MSWLGLNSGSPSWEVLLIITGISIFFYWVWGKSWQRKWEAEKEREKCAVENIISKIQSPLPGIHPKCTQIQLCDTCEHYWYDDNHFSIFHQFSYGIQNLNNALEKSLKSPWFFSFQSSAWVAFAPAFTLSGEASSQTLCSTSDPDQSPTRFF